MEPKGEPEGEKEKDQNEQPDKSDSSEEKKERKKTIDEKKILLELEEEERLPEDEEGEGSGSDEEEEEPPPPEPEEPPEPVKKKKKVVVEKKISENFYYNFEELYSFPYVTPDSGIPLDMLILVHSFGYDCRRRANIQMLDSQTLIYIAGNQLVLLDLKFRYLRYLRSTSGGGIGVITAHPNKTHFAVGEKGWKPNMIIYEYPSLKPYRILRGGTEKAYAFADFNRSGTLIATVGSSPDYMLTIWDWKQEKIILRSKAFSQDVYRVTFSPENEEQLTTSGSGHIKFWKMALTFTGLKLQGSLGRFGKTALTDIEGYVELPDGKVISGSEWGNMLLWEGGLIKVEICRPGHRNCHNGPINQLVLDEGEIVTVGSDGYIRVWDFETMDNADVVDDTGLMEMDPMNELLVGKNVNLGYMVKVHERGEPYWYAQDFNGAIWKLDLSFSNVTRDPECLFTFHSGKIEAVCVSPITYLLATTALDRMVRVYDFLGKVQLAEMKFKQGGTTITWAPKVANPKGGIIAVGFQDGVVRIIELYNPKGLPIVASQENIADAALRLKQAFKPHTTVVTALAYERHGEILATGSRDKTVFFFNVDEMYDPIGFISVPGPVQALQWSPPSHRENKLLIFCENGIVVQVPAPQQDYDAASTYKIKDLPTEYFRFWSIKSQILREDEIKRREKVKEEKEKERQRWIQEQLDEGKELEEIELLEEEPEEEEEEEPLPDIFVPETPSPILCGFYSAPGKFWLSLGGYDTGFLFHCAFSPMQHQKEPERREDKPFDFIRVEGAEDNPITRIWFCSSGLLMFCGMQNGAVRIYPLHQKEFSIDNIAGYWSFSLHDNEYGKIQGICSSFDDRFLVTCGADGNIFSYNILSVEEIKAVLMTKVPSPRTGLDQERAAEDIEEPSAYSIENAKQKKEYDAIMRAADRKKYLKRQELLSLRQEFQELLRLNDELPKHMQLHRAQFELDRRIRAEMDRRTAQKIRLVMKELGWEQERHRIGLRKLQERFRGNLEYDTIVVCAMRSSHRISTYRLLAISEQFYKSRKQSQSWKRRMSKYDWKAKEDQRKESQKDIYSSQTSAILEEETETEKVKKKPQTLQSRIIENRMERLRKVIEKAEKAKAKIEQRKKEWEELYKSKPSDNYEDPQDIEDIRYAQENMGDFKLKTATNYKIPEHMRINAAKKMNQLTSLEVAIHEKKLSMNKWIVGLRDLKVAIIEEIQCVVQALTNIQSSLDPSKHLPVPPVPQLLPEETPEKKFQYDSEKLLTFRQELEEQGLKVKEPVPVFSSAEGGGLGGFGGGFLHTSSMKEIDTSTRGGSLKSVKTATTAASVLPVESFEMELVEPTELEVEIRKREEIRNIYMQEALIKRIDELMMTFDAELCLLRHQKLKLDVQMKTADLRHITWFQELLLLKNFEKHEDILQERVNSLISEEEQMQHKINSCLAQIEEKKAEIVKLQEREKALYVTFQASLGENNKFAGFLLKVLKKRIKRVKKKEVEGERDDEDESEEESDEESSLESDEEESGSEDEVFDDTVCPKNCDESLFENTLQLREKRLDIEEALVEEKKVIENVKKEYEALSKKVRVVAASLDSAEWELEAYQREKQQKLNELHVVVPLKTHQVEYISNGEIPSDISQALVFTNQSLVNLQERITVLQQEKLEQRELYKKAREQHKQLIRDRKEMMIRIDRLEEKCNQYMMMKFGRLVNLEALQTLSVNTNLEELKMKTMEKEQAIAVDLKKWEDRILEKRQELMAVTKENTSKLAQMNAFCTEKIRLEAKLDGLQNNLGAEFQGPRKEDIMEKERLIALVQLQATDAEILKEEITLLSRKDGRIFAAPEPLFETDEMLN